MTTEKTREPAAGSAIGVDDGGGGADVSAAATAAAAAATTAALSSPVAYFRDALPAPLLAALRADAEGLACCPNFWVPRSVLSGEEPAAAAFEQAAAALARRCLSSGRWRRRKRRLEKARAEAATEEEDGSPQLPPLHPLLSVFKETTTGREEEDEEEEEEEELLVSGAECWLQLYENGRGLDPHYDKDEEASARGERPLRHPRVSTVVYLNGEEEEEEGRGEKTRNRFGATVVINQRLHPRSGAPLPAVPTSSALLWPRKGAAAAFDGRLAHCVLSSSSVDDVDGDDGGDGDASASSSASPSPPSAFDEGKRATVLFNFWCGRAPGGVLRVSEEDIVAAGLSRPVEGLEAEEEQEEAEGENGSKDPTPVPPAAVSVPADPAASLCLLDDLLRPQNALGHPFVVVSHPGFELVEAEVHREGGEEGEGEGAGEGEKELGTKKKAAAASAVARGAQVVFLPLSEDSDSD